MKFVLSAILALSWPGTGYALATGDHAGDHADDSAIGVPGDANKVSRMISITMSDKMRFTPSSISVRQGETVRFRVKNAGKLKHELILGTEKELKEHHEAMKKNPGMEHDEPGALEVEPGKTGELVWNFTKAGKVDFVCFEPGHYEAGMKGQVVVAAGKLADLKAQPGKDAVKGAPAATGDLTEGEVRKIDKAAGKITLKHGAIKNLEMPGMTMVFQVKDPALLEKFQVGDKVGFRAEKSGGAMVVTEIQAR